MDPISLWKKYYLLQKSVMRNIFLVVVALCLFRCDVARSQAPGKRTIHVKNICRQIDRDTTFRKITIEKDLPFFSPATISSRLTGYYKDSSLVKMRLRCKTKDAIEIFDYYYENNALIHVYNEYWGPRFDKSGKRIPNKYESNFHGYYYFLNGQLTDEISTGHNRFESDEISAETELQKEAAACKAMLRNAQH